VPFVFLANIDPELQYEVLQQVPSAKLRAMDTMNYWIESKPDALARTVAAVDVVTMNEAEARQFAGTSSLIAAARAILAMGPKTLVVKKGEYGCVLFTPKGYFFAPAYPLEEVRDPTGAGDSFAGGFIGYLARCGHISEGTIRRAAVHGSVVASFTVEDFSLSRLRTLNQEDIDRRFEEFRSFVHFDGP
jgi:sugar/nucleoside kinase (ribokinase family)